MKKFAFIVIIAWASLAGLVFAEKTPVGKVWDADLVNCGPGNKWTNCNQNKVTETINCGIPTTRVDDSDLNSVDISHFELEAILEDGDKVIAKRFTEAECPFPVELHSGTWRLRAKTFLHNQQESLFSTEIIHVIP